MQGKFNFFTRSGQSFARGLTIDPLLSDEDTKVLYERWNNTWAEPLEFQGGAKAITCDMVGNVPPKELVKVYGKQRAARLLEVSEKFKEV